MLAVCDIRYYFKIKVYFIKLKYTYLTKESDRFPLPADSKT